jgi:hypothetical protein
MISFYYNDTTIVLKAIKLIVLLLMSGFITYKKPKALFLPILLIICCIIGQITLKNLFEFRVLVDFGKFLYLIILLVFFEVYKLNKSQTNKMLTIFEWIVILNSILILMGFFLNIYLFKTYEGIRFGYDGFLITSATGTYFYIIALTYLLSKYRDKLFNKPLNIIVILSVLLVGTKALYLFLVGFFCAYIFTYGKGRIRNIIFSGVIIISITLGYAFFFEYGLFNEIRKSDGLITSFLSYRNRLFYEKTLPFINENWGILNYLFGGIDDPTTKSQIDFIDIFYVFGLIGGLLYLFIFFRSFLPIKAEYSIMFLLGLLMFIVFFGGNFFSYASVAIYVVILREVLKYYERG